MPCLPGGGRLYMFVPSTYCGAFHLRSLPLSPESLLHPRTLVHSLGSPNLLPPKVACFHYFWLVQVSLILHSIPGSSFQRKCHKSLYTGARSAGGWLVWVQAYCGKLYKAFLMTSIVIVSKGTKYNRICNKLGIRKFPCNNINIWVSFLIIAG